MTPTCGECGSPMLTAGPWLFCHARSCSMSGREIRTEEHAASNAPRVIRTLHLSVVGQVPKADR